jgi:probable rRNA maturation factor
MKKGIIMAVKNLKILIADATSGGVHPRYKHMIRTGCEAVMKYEKKNYPAEISVLLAGDEKIRSLNRFHRGKDKPTDVLSFPMDEKPAAGKRAPLGDIVISAETAARQALRYGHPLENEILFLTIHSMLHLLGYDHVNDKSEAALMRLREKEIYKSVRNSGAVLMKR